ncbi:MAG: dihydrolipoyl dehydrogenase [Acidobacteria bacterium]|nr:MAG: dihydrolipoyl dehydrogenase [Acidobacteriota bacterium]REJ98991.1 MAG: dihydrolipoyl dehydrogenase [Acidobacteriota bacterium]REK16289.1 MAG: dihydrolipoyl dehydrogenase [Acidobacteriota bacterium]REK43970.1 MAG: dihydrolipoyl dehydrogenase [Acidobacteriota bacterium]
MAEKFDVTIIGSGPGGYVAAVRGAQMGLKVAIIEKEDTERLGGTCGLRGCIPTKALLMAAHLYEKASHFEEFGIKVDKLDFDWTQVQKRKSDVVNKNAAGVSYLMKKNKVQVYNGFGKILGPGKVEVTGENGKKETVESKNIIIATGSVVRPIPAFETDGKQVVNSDHILELENVPKSMIVIGSGAVGVEFASVYARFGCDVTVVELLDRIVPIEDADVSKQLERSFKKQGIKCMTGVKLDTMKKLKNSVKVSGKDSKDKAVELEAEMVLVAIGRMPFLEGLGLENTKVKVSDRGVVEVNEYCETAEPGIFAIGDVIDTPWLAHLASKEGIMVVERLAGKNVEPINMNLVPNCTYCDPEVASVGMTEQKAKDAGYDVKVGKFPFSASGKARIIGETDGFVKVVSEKKYDEVLGVHIIGPHATELLAEACVAMRLETTADELGQTMHAHPTVSETIMEAAEGVHDLTIHI